MCLNASFTVGATSGGNVSEAYLRLVTSVWICRQSPALMTTRKGSKISTSNGGTWSNGPSSDLRSAAAHSRTFESSAPLISSGQSWERSGCFRSFSVKSRLSSSLSPTIRRQSEGSSATVRSEIKMIQAEKSSICGDRS